MFVLFSVLFGPPKLKIGQTDFKNNRCLVFNFEVTSFYKERKSMGERPQRETLNPPGAFMLGRSGKCIS